MFKKKSSEHVVEGTTLGGLSMVVIVQLMHECLFTTDVSDCEKLYSLDVLGIEDMSENNKDEVPLEFTESIARKADGRYASKVLISNRVSVD